MELRDLKIIRTIANEKSISKAADVLHVSQPSLSNSLRNIEDEIKHKLFIRKSSGVELTEAGQMTLMTVNEILGLFDDLQKDLAKLDSIRQGKILLGTTSYRGVLIMPDVLEEFFRIHPNIQIEIVEDSSKHLEGLASRGMVNVALVLGPLMLDNVASRLVAREEVFIVASKENEEMQEKTHVLDNCIKYIDIEDLKGQSFILLESGKYLREIADNLFSRWGMTPKMRVASTVNMTQALTARNLGISFCSQMYKKRNPNLIYLRIGTEGLFRNMFLVYKKGSEISGPIEDMSMLISKYVNKTLNDLKD